MLKDLRQENTQISLQHRQILLETIQSVVQREHEVAVSLDIQIHLELSNNVLYFLFIP
jgi:hypothetical protein